MLVGISYSIGSNLPFNGLVQIYDGKWNTTDTAYWQTHILELNDGSANATEGNAPGFSISGAGASSSTRTSPIRQF
jgi:hypothetical protein